MGSHPLSAARRARQLLRAGVLLLVTLLAAPAPAPADDASGLRTFGLEQSLLGVRSRLGDVPRRRSDFDLERARRDVRWLQVERPRDPRPWHLEREIERLQWRADRLERRDRRAQSIDRLTRARLPVPVELRQPYDTDLRGTERPIGAGGRYVLLQKSLLGAERALRNGQTGAASRLIDEASAGLARLKASVPPALHDDPNLVAAERQLAALEAELAARTGGS